MLYNLNVFDKWGVHTLCAPYEASNESWAVATHLLDKVSKWATGTILEPVQQDKFRQEQEGGTT